MSQFLYDLLDFWLHGTYYWPFRIEFRPEMLDNINYHQKFVASKKDKKAFKLGSEALRFNHEGYGVERFQRNFPREAKQ